MSLTTKQALFVTEYLKCFNATEAARRAGYQGNDATLATVGCENIRKPNIAKKIQQYLQESAMSADEVLNRLAEQARGDHSTYIEENGSLDLKNIVGDGKAHLIKRIKETKYGTEYEFYDAQSALALIGKHHALFVERSQQLQIDLTRLTDEQLDRLAAGENIYSVLATQGESGAREAETEREEKAE